MGKHRSVGERLGRTQSLAARREIAHEWWANWHDEHCGTIARLERAIGSGRMADAGRLVGQLKALDDKAISALPRIIDALTDEDIA